MSYSIYSTSAIIIRSYNIGENDRAYQILTRDFGVVFAKAKNIRGESSKLRYKIERGQKIILDLVRGKESFRITGAHSNESLNILGGEKSIYFERILTFLGMLAPFEQKGDDIFDLIEKIHAHLSIFPFIHKKEADFLEYMYKSHILNQLGYWDSSDLIPFPESRKQLLVLSSSWDKLYQKVREALDSSQISM